MCAVTATETLYGVYLWPETQAGTIINYSCVYGPPDSSISRGCNSNGEWDEINYSDCNTQYQMFDIVSSMIVAFMMAS